MTESCIHEPLAPSPVGLSCSACGYRWQAPYFLRYQMRAQQQAHEAIEAGLEAKRLKKEAKAQRAVAIASEGDVQALISPSVAAYFTDDVAVVGALGKVWKCEKCHRAPRKHPDFANKWKWKTAKGFEGHKCLG